MDACKYAQCFPSYNTRPFRCMEPSAPILSLIISTRNRCSVLARALESLRKLTTSISWELVVIDNGSSDDTQLVIQHFVATFSRAVQLVVEPRRGLANAHNTGFRKARSPICVFIDDDCYPSDTYLDAISLCFAEDPKIGFIGGRILPWSDDDCDLAVQKSTNRVPFPPYSFIPTGVIHGANFACRRAAIEAAGGFDSRFGPGALFFNAEEIELLARISSAGWAGAYDPRPLVYHDHGRKRGWDEWWLMRSYDRGRGGYYAKCLLNRTMRAIYLPNWWRRLRKQSWNTSLLEFVSAVEFVIRAMLVSIARIIVPRRKNES
jgi:glycosyltransferase involved in cell wall biosynthesis